MRPTTPLTPEVREALLASAAQGLPPRLAAPLAGVRMRDVWRCFREDPGFFQAVRQALDAHRQELLGQVRHVARGEVRERRVTRVEDGVTEIHKAPSRRQVKAAGRWLQRRGLSP